MSFLKIGDRAAGAIKSGRHDAPRRQDGDLRRRTTPTSRPSSTGRWARKQKVAALVAGSKLLAAHANAIITACATSDLIDGAKFDPKRNKGLAKAVRGARQAMLPEGAVQQAVLLARQGFDRVEVPTFDADWDSAAYLTVSGQNSNNSVRVSDAFLEAVEGRRRVVPDPAHRRGHREVAECPGAVGQGLLRRLGHRPIPACSTTRRSTTGTPARAGGGSTASNPCSEYMFLDDHRL